MADAGRARISLGWPHLALVAGYVAVATWLHARSTFVVTTFAKFSDWSDYQTVASSSVLSDGFWTGVKPAGYPLLVKVLGDGWPVHWAAVVLSVVAWSALALSLAMFLSTRWLGVVACAFVLAFSLSERIQVWNDLAGSETLSVSLFVLALAGALVLLDSGSRERRPIRIAAWIVLVISATWWCFTRDSNISVVVLAAIVTGALAFRFRSRALAAACGLALTVSATALIAADAADRWVVPYYNVVLNRVLTDRDLTATWRQAGMPDSPSLREHVGEIAYGGDPALFREPRLAPFRRWVRDDGRRTYLENLVVKPSLGIGGPVDDLDELLTSPIEVWGRIGGRSYRGSPLDPVFNTLFVPDMAPLVVWSLAVLASAAWLLARSRGSRRRGALLGVTLFVLALPHLWVVWVGDAHNIARHALTASLQLRVAGWIILALALDGWLARRRSRHSNRAELPAPIVPTEPLAAS
jgi:hypothetical protein